MTKIFYTLEKKLMAKSLNLGRQDLLLPSKKATTFPTKYNDYDSGRVAVKTDWNHRMQL